MSFSKILLKCSQFKQIVGVGVVSRCLTFHCVKIGEQNSLFDHQSSRVTESLEYDIVGLEVDSNGMVLLVTVDSSDCRLRLRPQSPECHHTVPVSPV